MDLVKHVFEFVFHVLTDKVRLNAMMILPKLFYIVRVLKQALFI